MDDAPTAPQPRSALAVLKYMQVPTVAFYYLGAYAFSPCVLQKAKTISYKRRKGILTLTVITLLAYTAELLYYFSRFTVEKTYEPPKPAAIRCLGSLLT
jgi:hypothetical protein